MTFNKINLALSFALCIHASIALSQTTIKGTVVDASTNEPLGFANVFLNNTTLGANCDESGRFKINKVGAGEHQLVVSFVGHENYQTKVVIRDTTTVTLHVRLTLLKIQEVEVVASRDKDWEKDFEKFKKLFLGEGFRDTDVRIVNPASLNFNDENNVMSATAGETLEIENYLLGYNIEYDLRTFLVGPVSYNIVGFVRFREMKTADPAVEKRWNENRFNAYRGSYRHLFKSIIDGQVEQSGFALYEDISNGQPRTSNLLWANIDKFITRHNVEGTLAREKEVYKLKLPKRLEVHYKKKSAPAKYYKDASYPISWVETTNRYVNLDEFGSVLNYSSMVVSGAMSEQRVGEMLPRDYVPIPSGVQDDPVPDVSKANPYIHFIEKPYIQTDRSYYYHNDVLWFKAYMNYSNLLMRDSLSRVLNVELIGPGKVVVARKFIRLISGIGQGSIDLPAELPPGTYQLRAYTRWQLNFSPSTVFARPIRLLAGDEIVQRDGKYELHPGNLQLSVNKEKILAHDSVELTVSLPQPIAANLSLAVVDISQGIPPANEMSITSTFPIAPSDTAGLPTSPKYVVQEGIDISGRMVDAKGGGQEGILNILEKKSGMALAAATGNKGDFIFSNLDFADSLEFLFQAKPVNKKTVTVSIDPPVSPEIRSVGELDMKVLRNTDPTTKRWRPSPFEKVEMLPEVTVESQKIEDVKTPIKKMANFSISGEWLRKNNVHNVASALQIRVPGLFILTFYDGKALPYRVVMFQMRHTSFFPGGPLATNKEEMLLRQEPLILINDALVNFQLGDGAWALERLRAEEIERIDVYRSNAYGNYGPRGNNGVIAIYTRNPMDYATPKPSADLPVQKIKIGGFASSRNFADLYKQNESMANRATIFWTPDLIVNDSGRASIKFASGDAPAAYRIVIEGVTASGEPVRGEALVTVTPN